MNMVVADTLDYPIACIDLALCPTPDKDGKSVTTSAKSDQPTSGQVQYQEVLVNAIALCACTHTSAYINEGQ